MTGLTITRNKNTVYAAVGPRAVALDVKKAVAGEGDPIVGVLSGIIGNSSIEVTLSSDDKYLFVKPRGQKQHHTVPWSDRDL